MSKLNVVVTYPEGYLYDNLSCTICPPETHGNDYGNVSVDIRTAAAFYDFYGEPIESKAHQVGHFAKNDEKSFKYKEYCIEQLGEFDSLEEAKKFIYDHFTIDGKFPDTNEETGIKKVDPSDVFLPPEVEDDVKSGDGKIIETFPIWISPSDKGYTEDLADWATDKEIISEDATLEEIKEFSKIAEEEYRRLGVAAYADDIEETILLWQREAAEELERD